MSTEENKQIVQRFISEALNNKNLNILNEVVAEDFIEQVPFPGQGPGREGLRYTLNAFISAFPDMHWSVDEQIAENDTVVTRFTMTGTNEGSFMGMPATGKSVSVWGVVIDEVSDGRMAVSRILMDAAGLMRQLAS